MTPKENRFGCVRPSSAEALPAKLHVIASATMHGSTNVEILVIFASSLLRSITVAFLF